MKGGDDCTSHDYVEEGDVALLPIDEEGPGIRTQTLPQDRGC